MEGLPLDRSMLTGLRLGGRDTPRSLADGTILDLTVTRASKGSVTLKGRGVSLRVLNGAGLQPGERLTVRVVAQGRGFRLAILHRTADPPDLDQNTVFRNLLTRLGVSDGPVVRGLFSAFFASGRPVDPALFRRALEQSKVLTSRGGRGTAGDTRASLELSDRELTVDLFDTDDLARLIGAFSGYDGGSGTRDGSHRPVSPESGASGETELRRFLNRTADRVTDPLQLYNALRPRSGDLHWTVIPIHATAGADRLSAVMKLGVDPATGRTREVVMSVSYSGGRAWFRWNTAGPVKLVAAGRDDGEDLPQELLARLGGTGHTESATAGDGFSLDTAAEDEWTVGDYG